MVKVRKTLAMYWAALERESRRFDGTGNEITPRERHAARTTFYAGAASLFRMVNGCNSSDEFVEMMERVEAELDTFHHQVREEAELLLEALRRGAE